MQNFSEIIILLENVSLSEKYGSIVCQVFGLLLKKNLKNNLFSIFQQFRAKLPSPFEE